MTKAVRRVLIVEDDDAIRNVVRVLLQTEHYQVVEAETAARGEIEARAHRPDLLLVDMGLPDGDGLNVIRRVRAWSPVPIIVLSARTMEEQKVAALDAGADDYVTKPFNSAELLARVRAAFRRTARAVDGLGSLRLGEVVVDLERRVTQGAQGEIHLTALEYRLLECFARHSGLIVTQGQLIREVWGPGRQDDTRSLRVAIKNLRAKVEPDSKRPRYLQTEIGLGYRLKVDEDLPL